ncbi:hypothetical protein [Planctomicrobium piriforme]|uniref:hypothetical protein n=1 Tax=Planctomicrobium piriforme TaxID=1576369 RepID=UPI000B803CAC|nr:hypothetical protein [Planctomicrobium piriforme]
MTRCVDGDQETVAAGVDPKTDAALKDDQFVRCAVRDNHGCDLTWSINGTIWNRREVGPVITERHVPTDGQPLP